MRPDWYRAFLPRASNVYRDDARLWLGLTHLLDPETIPGRPRRGPIVLDHDLKPLIESVYADEEDVAARVPAALRPALDAAAGRATEFRRAGQKNRLTFTQGLVADCTSDAVIVLDDAFLHAPTRLGESYTVLIAFRTQADLKLAGAGSQDPIAASEVRTRWRLTQLGSDAAQETLSRSLTPAQRKRLSYAELVVLSWDGEKWEGLVERNGRRSILQYCQRRGLMVLRSSPQYPPPEKSGRDSKKSFGPSDLLGGQRGWANEVCATPPRLARSKTARTASAIQAPARSSRPT
jgi:hypothetical protein